ncbi:MULTISPECIES: diaminopimelate decarboxylase [Streptomyces]|uniref:Diaminopimelate decarboxylase n=2 Tax=Streptomyces TaxID=1883 RepID=A0ABT9LES3_STRGD|nr:MULTISPECIES: diaminopimelate decarboxylase [Streptomyces]MDP9682215.1 diaminopimelate decarboxylase [Streptomyces griseoviridis]GGS83118.1 diaminopimelate decarboxylase [Streptomyces griseoviridis]GGU17967.1 diaminopimelate decarboxylase [Streptomyces daghestanicus]GHI33780.1 diaminopimelate decarboxylase [Streptomyces daghestanicus]
MSADFGTTGNGTDRGEGTDEGTDAVAGRRAARRDAAVRAAVAQGLLGPGPGAPVVGLLDVTGIRESARALRAAFAAVTAPGTPVLHAFAVKASPLVPVVRLLWEEGIGAEVASPGELALARAAGVPAERTVLDSPAKTPEELREALALGIAVNADNPQELERLDGLTRSARTASPLGIRVNPQVGGGSIEALATATATSKFGVALRDEGAREWVVRACLDRPWLTRLHVHTGSQGIPPARMAEGVAAVYALAEEVNGRAGRRQVDTVDIGGGLPVNFASEVTAPTYGQYARALREAVPGLFDGRYGLVTEFGRSLLAKHGTVVARVEYTKSAGGRPVAVTHAGVQVATRTVYAPRSWPLRIAAYDGAGRPKEGPPVVQDVAGPACFAGDLLATGRALPRLEQGDHAAALDTGAYYFAHHYAYNSLARPGVYGFLADEAGSVRFRVVREAQPVEEIVAEAGGAHAESLTRASWVRR